MLMRMISHLTRPVKINLTSKLEISTELSKLPGKYKLASQTGMAEYYKAKGAPDDIIRTIHDDTEIYLSLQEKDGIWHYKTVHFTNGLLRVGNNYTFKEGEKFTRMDKAPTDADNIRRDIEMSMEIAGDSLVLEAPGETLILKSDGDNGLIREVKFSENDLNVPIAKGFYKRLTVDLIQIPATLMPIKDIFNHV